MAAERRKGKARKPTGKERLDRARNVIAASIDPARVMLAASTDRELAKVVVDPLRVQILMTGSARKLSAKEFAEEWDIPDWGAHYQFKVLRERQFIEAVEEVKRRGATEIYYRTSRRCIIPDADWAALSPVLKGPISHAIVEELWLVILQAGEAETLDARDESILWWQEVRLDEITFPKAMAMQRLLIQKLVELGEETAQNQAEGKGGASFPGVLALMGFEGAPERKPVKRRRGGETKLDPKKKRKKKGKE